MCAQRVLNQVGGAAVFFVAAAIGPPALAGAPPAEAEPAATAQPADAAGGGIGELIPGVSHRELDWYADRLSLTEDQRLALDALFDGYTEEYRSMSRALRAQIETLQRRPDAAPSDGGPVNAEEVFAALRKWTAKTGAADKRLFEDVRAMLTPEQAELWPKLERDKRRERELLAGQLAGESVDLVEIVDQLGLGAAARAEVDPIVERYALDLDRVLAERQSHREAIRERGSTSDFAEMLRRSKESWEYSNKVREMNLQYGRKIAAVLPSDQADRFAEMVRQKTFPMIYGEPSWALRAIDAALKLDDLDAAQRTAVESMKESVARELENLNKAMESAWRQREEDNASGKGLFTGRGNAIQIAIQSEDKPKDDRGGFDGLMKQRRELEEATEGKLRALLSPSQAEKIPPRPSEPEAE